MKDVELQAKALLARAQQQAEELLAAAQAEALQIRKVTREIALVEGRAEGLASGRQEGLRIGREEALSEQRAALTQALNALTHAATSIDTSRRGLEAAALKDVLKLAIAIAQRITKRQGAMDSKVTLANIEEALHLVTHASDVRIAIHPTQKAALDEALPKLKLRWPTLEYVEIIEDASLSPGGCRIFTARGRVEADLEGQLDRIAADLLPENQEALG